MQEGKTAVEDAADKGYHQIVNYFVKECDMKVSQFDVVCNIDTIFCVCVFVCACACNGGWGYTDMIRL